MIFSKFSILDFKGIQFNLIETNFFKFHDFFLKFCIKNAQTRTNFFNDEHNKLIIISIPCR